LVDGVAGILLQKLAWLVAVQERLETIHDVTLALERI
jgi:hypothetical protein